MESYGFLLAMQRYEELSSCPSELDDPALGAKTPHRQRTTISSLSLAVALLSLMDSSRPAQAYVAPTAAPTMDAIAASQVDRTASDRPSNASVLPDQVDPPLPTGSPDPAASSAPDPAVPTPTSHSVPTGSLEQAPATLTPSAIPAASAIALPTRSTTQPEATDPVAHSTPTAADAAATEAAPFVPDRLPLATPTPASSPEPNLIAPINPAVAPAPTQTTAIAPSIARVRSAPAAPKLLAQAITPAADGTGTQITQVGNRFDITGGTLSRDQANLFHSFQRLGLSADQIANFMANPKIHNILGRVVGGEASQIDGLVRVTGSNANLYLMNPAGIVFGPNARLDVPGSFTATTASGIKLGEQWFNASGSNNYAALVGNPTVFAFTAAQPGAIVNAGQLAVPAGQALNLIGGTVVNTGSLSAPGGQITVTAVPGSKQVQITQDGVLLALKIQPLDSGPNPIPFTPASLPALLTGPVHNMATGVVVNPDGTAQLAATGTVVPTTPGTAIAAGTLNTSGQTGGIVSVVGDRVNVVSSTINASGTNGGGTVLVGGDYQGKGSVPNAQSTVVSQDSMIRADALTHGNGGKVVVWADGDTRVGGTITAKGGAQSGDGGLVETSGQQSLMVDQTATVNTTALQGQTGTWLLDPADLTVVASGGAGTITGGNNSTADSTINNSTIVTALNNSQVNLSATNSITVNAPIDASGNANANALTFTASTISINQPLTLKGDLTITGTGNISSGAITTPGHAVKITGGNINVGTIDTSINAIGSSTNGGTVTIQSNGGSITTSNLTTEIVNGLGAAGNITLNVASGTGSIDTRSGTLNAFGANGSGGTVSLSTQSGNITTGRILTESNTTISGAKGGDVTLRVNGGNGNIDTTGGEINSVGFNTGPGGSITLATVNGNIATANLTSRSRLGKGGDIAITGALTASTDLTVDAGTGNVTTGGITNTGRAVNITGGNINVDTIDTSTSVNTSTPLNGGNIRVTATTGNVNAVSLRSFSEPAASGPAGTGGTINVSTPGSILITDPFGILSQSEARGVGNSASNAGAVTLQAGTGITIKGEIDTRSQINADGGNTGNAGAITLTTTNGNIQTGLLFAPASVNATNGTAGNGGNIAFNAPNGDISVIPSVSTGNAGLIAVAAAGSGSGNAGNGGTLTLNARGNININVPIASNSVSRGGSTGTNGAISLNASNTTLTNDEIDLTSNVSGTGNLTLQPSTAKQSIALGGTTDSGAGTLDLTATDLNALQRGFSSITIGRDDGSGAITLAGDVTFNDPVTLRSPVGAGSINTTSKTLTGADNATITLLANQAITTGAITNPGHAVTITGGSITTGAINTHAQVGSTGDITLTAASLITTGTIDTWVNGGSGGKVALTLTGSNGSITTGNITALTFESGSGGDVTANANGGTIQTGVINNYANLSSNRGGAINLTNAKTITVGDINSDHANGFTNLDANGSDISLQATDAIAIGNISNKNSNISLNGPVTLSKNTTIGIFGTGGNVTLANSTSGTNNFTINAGTGNVSTGAITNPGNTVNITGGNITTGAINTHITSGSNADVTLTAQSSITTGTIDTWVNDGSGGKVALTLTGSNGTVNTGNIRSLTFDNGSGGDVTINAPNGTITTGTIDNYANRSRGKGGSLDVTNARRITVGDINNDPLTGFTDQDANGSDIVLQASDAIAIGNIRYKNSNISLNGPVTLSKDTTISILGTGGNVTFASSISGTNDLTINAGTGNVTTGAITTPSHAVNITGGSITAGDISTSIRAGDFEDGGNVALTASTGNLSVGQIDTQAFSFFGFIGNGGDVSLNAAKGDINITGPITTNTTAVGRFDTANNAGNIEIKAPTGTVKIAGSLSAQAIALGELTRVGNSGQVDIDAATTNLANTAINTDTLAIGADSTTGAGGPITLATDITAASDLTVNAGTGNVIAEGIINPGHAVNITGGSVNVGTIDTSASVDTSTPVKGGNIRVTAITGEGNGISFNGAINTGGGNIQATGSSTTNQGIITRSTINSSGGNISFNGTSSGTGDFARGIDIGGAINSGGGSITFNGIGNGEGIVTFSPINSGGGAITFTGTSTGTGTFARGIALVNSVDSQGGAIDFTGSGASIGISTFANGTISSGTGNITLTADRTLLQNSISGKGNLLLQPLTPTQNLTIGGTDDAVSTFLNNAELANLTGGFNSITIGRDNGSGTITVAGNTTFQDPVTLRTPAGSIALNGGVVLPNNTPLNFISQNQPTTLLNQDITGAPGTPLNFFGDVQLGGDITISTQSGSNIQFNGAIDGSQLLTLNAGTGAVKFAGAVGRKTPLNSLVITSGTTEFDQGAKVIGDITLNSAVNLPNGGTLESTGGQLSVGGNVNSSGNNLSLKASKSITAGVINAANSSGKGGDVLLDPQGDIQVTSIDARGTTGGKVNIVTARAFRATSTIDGTYSIATAPGGSINITVGLIPFTIGNAQANGTAGAITDGTVTLSSLSLLRPFAQGNIAINPLVGNSDLTRNLVQPQQQGTTGAQDTLTPGSTLASDATTAIPVSVSLNSIDQTNATAAIPVLEKASAAQFQEYFGRSQSDVVTTGNANATLQTIAAEAGVKPALVYISFVPADANERQNSTFALDQGRDRLELILVTAKGQAIRKTIPGITRSIVLTEAAKFRDAITDPIYRRTTEPLKQPAGQLYKWFIAPLKPMLQAQGIQNLAFILDTGLRSLPMAALYDEQNQQYLVEQYSMGLMPTLSLTDTRYQNIRKAQVLAMGTSQFPQKPGLGPLPAVPLELTVIQKQWPTQLLTDANFTVASLNRQPPYGILHLATHASFQAGPPDDSFIQFKDMPLTLAQLRNLNWRNHPPELIVLSACRTAFGSPEAELGFAGAALQARVKSVLASLWSVSDIGASGLMAEFYHDLQRAPIKAAALQDAQIAMLRGKVYIRDGMFHWSGGELPVPDKLTPLGSIDLSHPYYWSAFTLVGSPW